MIGWLVTASLAQGQPAQQRPYIGFVYPAGGQQGTIFKFRLGGQALDEVTGVLVTGTGVTARISDNYRRLDPQELQLLSEQTSILRHESLSESARALLQGTNQTTMSESAMTRSAAPHDKAAIAAKNESAQVLLEEIEKRTREYVLVPASAALVSLVIVEAAIAPDAQPGEREIRLVTLRGISNPLPFYVGQVPETSRKPMIAATQQVLGKEGEALRKRLPGEEEDSISVPCTVNGQIASGEVNRYRFQARKGQHLVITTLGRQLVPFIADAVPGWFQPVLQLCDGEGKELAYGDNYQFKPDPTIFYEIPKDGEYMFSIHDSLYRGREDFVYRITIGELPFITSIFPLGGPAAAPPKPEMKGWNLQGAELSPLPADARPGIHSLAACGRKLVSNRVPIALDHLPETLEQEPNNALAKAQKVTLPIIVNGRISQPDDWDVFEFTGKANDTLVAEIQARRLDSPLDSLLKLTDAAGKLLAFNDDHEDLGAGLNTHAADSYLMFRLPADGSYFVHVGDTARRGGEDFGYRLRLSAPQPDFDLRVAPSSLGIRSKSAANLTVYVQRKDGFVGPLTVALKDPSPGFSAAPVTLSRTQTVAQLTVLTDLVATREPVSLSIVGTAKIGGHEIAHEATPAEDRMQAFLWRQLVPAKDLQVLVFDPAYEPPPKRIARPRAQPLPNVPVPVVAGSQTNAPPKFAKQEVAGRMKMLRLLFDEGMLTDDFYNDKVAECEAAQ